MRSNLTPRQVEIMCLVRDGLNNSEIAGRLSIRESSVKNHLQMIMVRLGVSNRTSAVIKSIRRGYIALG